MVESIGLFIMSLQMGSVVLPASISGFFEATFDRLPTKIACPQRLLIPIGFSLWPGGTVLFQFPDEVEAFLFRHFINQKIQGLPGKLVDGGRPLVRGDDFGQFQNGYAVLYARRDRDPDFLTCKKSLQGFDKPLVELFDRKFKLG